MGTLAYLTGNLTITGGLIEGLVDSSDASSVTDNGEAWVINEHIGRYIAIHAGTGKGQFRVITSNTSTSLTVHKDWEISLDVTSEYIICFNFEDLYAEDLAQGWGVIEKVGTGIGASYNVTSNITLNPNSGLTDRDKNITITTSANPFCKLHTNSYFLFGQQWGERETTNSCGLTFKSTIAINTNMFDSFDGTDGDNGFRFAMYGGKWHVEKTNGSTTFCFGRLSGVAHMIGANVTGDASGRFYHNESLWLSCRHSGNRQTTGTWSLGTTFLRDIEGNVFYKNLVAVKVLNFDGTIKNTVFEDSNTYFLAGDGTGRINLVDCTTVPSGKYIEGGEWDQSKTINTSVFDSIGLPIENARSYVVNKNNNEEFNLLSDVTGLFGTGLVKFRDFTNSVTTDFNPFVTKLRKYAYSFQEETLTIFEKIKSSRVLSANVFTNLSELSASALNGIAISGVAETITITGPRTAQEIYDYGQWWACQSSGIPYIEIFKTFDGINYSSGGTLILHNEVSNGINFQGFVSVLGIFDLTSHNISGSVTFNSAGTYTVTDSTIGEVINASGGLIVINAINSSIATNTGPSITINNAVGVSVTALDESGNPIAGARVLLNEVVGGGVVLSGITDANGVLSDPYNFLTDQDVSGKVRKSTGDPLYKQGVLIGTIVATGLHLVVTLVKDS